MPRQVADEIFKNGSEHDPGNPHHEECRAPIDPRGKIGADHGSASKTERNSERIDGECSGATGRREIIGNQRIGRSDSASFANPDSEPEQEELRVARRRAAQGRETAPHRKRAGDYRTSAGPVGEKSERDCKHRIEQGKSEAADRPELGIAKVQVGFDRLGKDAEDLPVEEVEDIGEQQEQQDAGAYRAVVPLRRPAQKFTPSETQSCRGAP